MSFIRALSREVKLEQRDAYHIPHGAEKLNVEEYVIPHKGSETILKTINAGE